jgi:hypothetical protein
MIQHTTLKRLEEYNQYTGKGWKRSHALLLHYTCVADTKVKSLGKNQVSQQGLILMHLRILDRLYVPSMNTFLIPSYLDVWKYAQQT